MNFERYQRYAPSLVRYALALVFLIFGIWQFIDPASWLGYVPSWVPVDHTLAVYANGSLDTLLGLALAAGFLTRAAALIGALHLLGIAVAVGFNDVAVRDIGLALVLIGIFLHGPDPLCMQKRKEA